MDGTSHWPMDDEQGLGDLLLSDRDEIAERRQRLELGGGCVIPVAPIQCASECREKSW